MGVIASAFIRSRNRLVQAFSSALEQALPLLPLWGSLLSAP